MLFAELLLLGGSAVYYANQNAKYKQGIKRYYEEGRNVKPDRERETNLISDYCYDFNFGEKKYVPQEYWRYFTFNMNALIEYCRAMAANEVWKQGVRPYFCDAMPRPGWDAFEGFHKKYDKSMEEYDRFIEDFYRNHA